MTKAAWNFFWKEFVSHPLKAILFNLTTLTRCFLSYVLNCLSTVLLPIEVNYKVFTNILPETSETKLAWTWMNWKQNKEN